MESHNKRVATRWFQEAWNDRNDASIQELMAADAIGHMEGVPDCHGPDGFRAMRDAFLEAIPDLNIEIDDIIADDERVVVRWHAKGTHTADGLGVRASRAPIDARGTTWLILRDGQLVEGWDSWNLGAMLESMRGHLATLEKSTLA